MRTTALAVLALTLLTTACYPYVSRQDEPMPPDPVYFKDARTGEILDEVLIVPIFSSFTGLGTFAGHGPGGGVDNCWIRDSFIHRAGGPLQIRGPMTYGLIWCGYMAWTGRSAEREGAWVLAPGYEPSWVTASDLFHSMGGTLLDPVDPEKENEVLQRLREILQGPLILESQSHWLGRSWSEIVKNNLSPREKREALEFLGLGPEEP